jgi:hypothetical protein
MKKLIKIAVLLGFTFTVALTTAFGQVPSFSFDENGRGFDLTGTPLPFSVGPDPSGGVAANVLMYQLPILVTPGDLVLAEAPPIDITNASDVVRFYNVAGANHSLAIFYSDNRETPLDLDLADSGLPRTPNGFPILEVGPEGANGALWAPLPGQPGSLASGALIQYQIISDVPEPSTFVIFGFGAAGLLIFRRRR